MARTTYRIRPVQPRDAARWEHLREQLWEGDDHRGEIAAYFNGEAEEPDEVLLAVDPTGEAVAHIELSLREDVEGLEGVRTGYIEGLFVAAPHRASGVTQQLLRAAEAWSREQGCAAFASDRDDRVIVHARYARDTA